jgi:hypothetical protein
LEKILPACQYKKSRLQIADPSSTKRSQLFIRAHNETLSVAATRVSNDPPHAM